MFNELTCTRRYGYLQGGKAAIIMNSQQFDGIRMIIKWDWARAARECKG
jgi:hypothetical protein